MIYLDHAAATPVNSDVLDAMKPYFGVDFFNPSAAYLPAKKVAADYEAAKATIAHAIGAKSHDLVMTAGATEANNLALLSAMSDPHNHNEGAGSALLGPRPSGPSPRADGANSRAAALRNAPEGLIPAPLSIAEGLRSDPSETVRDNGSGMSEEPRNDGRDEASRGRVVLSPTLPSRILYLMTEHDSVRRVAEALGGRAIMVDRGGRVNLDDLRAKITDEVRLITIALVNGEIGVIQPLSEVATLIREIRFDRLRRGVKTPLLLHSDASQALNLLDVNVARLGVDLMTLNSAKLYGPKGVGALYISHEAKISPQILGGGQENGLRSGTENVPGVIGFAKAVEKAKSHIASNRKKYSELKRLLVDNLQGCEFIATKHQLDNFVNLCYNGIDGERLVFLLEEREVYVATGAACAASKGEKSHVLRALGLSEGEIAGSLRLTLGEMNDKLQMLEAAKIINEVVENEYRRVNG